MQVQRVHNFTRNDRKITEAHCVYCANGSRVRRRRRGITIAKETNEFRRGKEVIAGMVNGTNAMSFVVTSHWRI
jgi:hypothetical protein